MAGQVRKIPLKEEFTFCPEADLPKKWSRLPWAEVGEGARWTRVLARLEVLNSQNTGEHSLCTPRATPTLTWRGTLHRAKGGRRAHSKLSTGPGL